MHKVSHKDFSCLLNMLDCIGKIQAYSSKFKDADDFYDNTISFDATMMNFIVIGEMVDNLSDNFITETSEQINWPKVMGFRNIIAHNYFGIDAEEVWQIINSSLPGLKDNLEKLIK